MRVNEVLDQEIPDPKDETHLRSFMRKKGWNFKGMGAYGIVFGNEKGYVAKFFATDDVCYSWFIQYCLAHSNNPHLPRVGGYKENVWYGSHHNDLTPQWYDMVVIEKLIPLSKNEDKLMTEILYATKPGALKNEEMPKWMTPDSKKESILLLHQVTDKHPEFIQTVIDFQKSIRTNDRCSWDMHEENIMKRKDGTYVITDPVI